MDERSLVHSLDARSIEHVSPPIFRTKVTGRTSAGVRIEITKTEEKLVAYIDDPAKLDLIYAQLTKLGRHEARARAGDPMLSTSPNTLPAVIVADGSRSTLLVFGSVVMLVLALTAAFLAGSRQHGPSQTNHFFVLPNDGDQARQVDARAARDAPNGSVFRRRLSAGPPPLKALVDAERDRRSKMLHQPDQPPAIRPPAMRPLAMRSLPAQDRADGHSAPPSLYASPSLMPVDEATPPSLSRQAALDAAFASGAVQTWSEGGNTGFVIADPLRQDGSASCRTMVMWKRGAAQGDVQKSVKCAGSASR